MKIGRNDRVVVSPNVHTREFDGELVVLDLARGEYFGLDETGLRVWNLLSAGQPVAQAAAVIATEYGVDDDRVTADVMALVENLVARGLVVVSPPDP
jgi:hypothetical protein